MRQRPFLPYNFMRMNPAPSINKTVFDQKKINLPAYLEHIRYNGSLDPTARTLKQIHQAHTQSIPFENLNALLRVPVQIDIDSIQKKIIGQRRGGWCFEHNILFGEALKTLGFQTRGLAARVMWNLAEDVIVPRGHMLLMVRINGVDYIADTGFGGLTLPEPLVFTTGADQQTSHEKFRIVSNDDGEYIIQAFIKEEWKPLYRFALSEYLVPDYEVINYYLSTNQNSQFLHNLIAARLDIGRRYNLRNREFTIHDIGNGSTKREIQNMEELKALLTEVFGIAIPPVEGIEKTFETILKK
jgi:N-hydroxyarylamine O-acetyltransferase